jgi:hypothetical protein
MTPAELRAELAAKSRPLTQDEVSQCEKCCDAQTLMDIGLLAYGTSRELMDRLVARMKALR